MQLEHLFLYNRIAAEKNISKVAAANHISQPALSQQMRRLEDEIGIKLFERSNRGIELTDAGRVLYKFSGQAIKLYDSFNKEIANLINNKGTFRIASCASVANYIIPGTLFRMQSKFSDYTFYLSSMSSYDVIDSVLEGQANVGFIVGDYKDSNIVSKKMFTDNVYLTAAAGYDIPERITVDELKRYSTIMLNEKFATYHKLKEQMENRGQNLSDFNVLYNLDSVESVKSSVLSRCGISFLPYMAIKKELYSNQLKTIEVEGLSISNDIYMIHKKDEFGSGTPIANIEKYLEKNIKMSVL